MVDFNVTDEKGMYKPASSALIAYQKIGSPVKKKLLRLEARISSLNKLNNLMSTPMTQQLNHLLSILRSQKHTIVTQLRLTLMRSTINCTLSH